MSLKQIIVVDEDGSKVTVRTSKESYAIEEMVQGKRHVRIGVIVPLLFVLRNYLKEEWKKVSHLGARLAVKHDQKGKSENKIL